MSSSNNILANKAKVLYALMLVSAIVLISSFYQRWITYDDAYFAEQSYWFAKKGYVKSELFRGFLDWEDRSFVYHKLHVWQGALLYKIAGWNPYYFKSLPLIYLVIFLFLARFYIKRFISEDNNVFYSFLFLIFVHSFIAQYGFEFRPEIMMMCVGFLSFLALRLGVTKSNNYFYLLAGVAAGAAALFHLNGLIFIVAGGALLLYNRRYSALLPFGVAATATCSLYFVEMLNANNFAQYLAQFRSEPAISDKDRHLTGWIIKLITGPKRFFSHVYEGSYTLLFLFVYFANRKTICGNDEYKQILFYFLVLEVVLSVISPEAKTMYLTYHIPYLLLIIAALANQTMQNVKLRKWFIFLIFLYTATQYGHTYSIISKHNGEIIKLHAEIVNKYGIKRHDKIIAPEQFIFNEIESAQIQGFTALQMMSNRGLFKYNVENIFRYAHRHNRKFIIGKQKYLSEHGLTDPKIGKNYYGYKLVGVESNLYIFRMNG